jgi:hypothetical protein
MGSGPDINYPQQPSYGEGMADAMKAQMEQLLGQGEYAQMYADAGFAGGNLGDIIAGVEAPIRQKTAQTDTDVLRQTLLGSEKKFQVEKDPDTGKYGITGAEVVKGEDGKAQTAGDGRYQMVQIGEGVDPVKGTGLFFNTHLPGITAKYAIIDTTTGGISSTVGGEHFLNPGQDPHYWWEAQNPGKLKKLSGDKNTSSLAQVSKEFTRLRDAVGESGADAAAKEFQFENPYTGEPLEEGQTVTIREGDGMIDLLGDKRKALDPTTGLESDRMAGFDAQGNFLGLSALAEDIQRGNLSRQREADLADVERLSDRFQTVMEDYKPGTTSGLDDARLLLEQQRENLTGLREATQADVDAGTATAIGEMIQTGRGGPVTIPTASTYGGDITPSTMTAATVGAAPELTAGTSFTGSTVADPTTLSASTSYTPTVNVTGGTFNAGTSYEPSAGVTGGKFDAGTSYTSSAVADPLKLSAATSYKPSAEVTGETYKAAQAANPMELAAATSYKPSAGVTGDGYTATAELEGGNIGADPLRKALMAQAIAAADNGLSDREIAQIENAARARSTMMGRTFDQQSAIDEAQAIVSQDNRRRMENRGFAQQFLGQEADIQRSDLERGLQANIRNQDALNRAAEFGASQDMQAQLANQAATNQALQAGMTAGLSQEALAAQQAQAKAFADQAAANRALEFGASTSMDAQRLNQAATNQALSQGIQAGLSQEALSAQQAQAKALADASAANRASEFGIGAGLDQEARANQAALQAALANQQATNQAAQFGVTAGMQQQAQANQSALQAALANQAASNQAAQYGVGAGLQQEALGAQQAQAKAMADAQFAQQAASQGLAAGLEQDALRAQLGQQTTMAQAQMDQQANAFDADAAMRAATVNQGQKQQAAQFGVGAQMDAERLNEQLRQQGLGNYINAVGNLAQIEDKFTLDPFQAILGRASGGSLQAGQGVFGQAGYGLQSGPQYLNPEAGLGYISQMAANDANMYAANVSANASRNAGLMGGLGALGGGLAQGVGAAGSVGAFFCWVAREVYGPTNPAWLQFREWMFTESPNWFFKLYAEYGERFANWVSNKPRIKSIIRKWMDSKIGG